MQLTELSNIFLGEAAASVASMVATPLHAYQLPGQKQFQATKCTPAFSQCIWFALIMVSIPDQSDEGLIVQLEYFIICCLGNTQLDTSKV